MFQNEEIKTAMHISIAILQLQSKTILIYILGVGID